MSLCTHHRKLDNTQYVNFFVAASSKISPLLTLLVKVRPSNLEEQLAFVEYLRETLLPPADTQDRVNKIKALETKIIEEEKERRDSKKRQSFTNDRILRNMVLYAWSVRKGSDIFNKEEFKIATLNFRKGKSQVESVHKSSKKKNSQQEIDYYVWSRVRNNFLRKLEKVKNSVILTVRKDMISKDNILRDESETQVKKKRTKNVVVETLDSASENDSEFDSDQSISMEHEDHDKENINPRVANGINKKRYSDQVSLLSPGKHGQSPKRSRVLQERFSDSESDGEGFHEAEKSNLKMRQEFVHCKCICSIKWAMQLETNFVTTI
jgi:hypothetical protein